MKFDPNNLPESSEALQKIIISLQDELDTKRNEVNKYKDEANNYKNKYERLVEVLRLAKQERFSPSSEKNIAQACLFDEADIELCDDLKEEVSSVSVAAHSRINKPKRKPLPQDLPREEIVYDIAESEKTCECGACLNQIGQETSEQLKYIPPRLVVLRHVRLKYACKPCQANVKIAPTPQLLLPKSIATPELVAHTILAKYCDHLPLYRQEAIWRRFDIDIPRSSLCGWVMKVAELCEPLVALLQKEIVNNTYAQADETTVQVLDEPNRKNTSKSYMWCYRGGQLNKPSIVYEYQETRGGYHAQAFLSGFVGYLQSDAYSGYNWADGNKKIVSIGCMAHARRPFAKLSKLAKQPGLAHEALKLFRALYDIEKEAREQHMTPEQRFALRQEKALSIIAKLEKWLKLNAPKTSEQGKIGMAIRYCLNHWEELTNYLKDGRIEIDNNLLENAIRPFTLGRKNWLFKGSPAGAKAGATCKAPIYSPINN